MQSLITELYGTLKHYLDDNSSYSPFVVKSIPNTPKYPLVVVKEINNNQVEQTFGNMETLDQLAYEIEIYATDKVSGTKTTSNEIATELQSLIDNVMSRYYCMTRISATPTPNIDKTIFRVIMRYTKKINSRGRLI